MPNYSNVAIIYNPNSTGPGKTLAEDLQDKLGRKLPALRVELIATEHAGHGEQLAYDIAAKEPRPLIISSSGDGGYHEVVNGVMRANSQGAHGVTGLLPAGNANDHFHSLHDGDLLAAIIQQTEQTIDLLKLTGTVNGRPYTQYAHSYIGIGFTPEAGRQLTRAKLNKFNQAVIVLKALLSSQAVRIKVGAASKIYTSLVFSNINRMSRVLTLSDDATPNDGKFEITANPQTSKLKLFALLLKASTTGLSDTSRAERFQFTTTEPLLVQLDGEVTTLDAGTPVDITLAHAALRCVI